MPSGCVTHASLIAQTLDGRECTLDCFNKLDGKDDSRSRILIVTKKYTFLCPFNAELGVC